MNSITSLALLTIKNVIRNRNILRDFQAIAESNIIDLRYYLSQLPPAERPAAKKWPIAHYLLVGEPRDLKPNPLFVTSYYRGQMHRNNLKGSPLLHYLSDPSSSAILPNPQFNSAQYVKENKDVAINQLNPLMHYYWFGFKENRGVPGGTFNPKVYLNRFPSLKSFNENPLAHYLERETEFPTELWGLTPGETIRESMETAPSAKSVPSKFSVELLIPVYRRPDCVQALYDSLSRSNDWTSIDKVTFIDDRGDTFTSAYLQQLKKQSPKIEVIVNSQNLGFLASCNNAYKKANSDIVILVNTDIRVPNNWLNRILQPFETDAKVALVTPLATNGANLSVSLRPGQSWCETDKILSQAAPTFPDACTAVGYAMAIRSKAIGEKDLFDTIYEHGYCEDTDLHYRLVQAGWRSVICDNLLVYHQGSASYELDAKKAAVYDANRKLFFDRWAKIHAEHEAKYLAANPLKHVLTPTTHSKFQINKRSLDVLFVAPTNNTSFGGVRIIFELATFLSELGIKCSILCAEHTAPIQPQARDLFMPYHTEERLLEEVSQVKLLVGTGLGVREPLDRLRAKYSNSTLIWLLQGPEGYFDYGTNYFSFGNYLRQSEVVVSVSEYLAGFASFLGATQTPNIPLGPNPYEYYQRDITRDPKGVAIHMIDTPDKGARFTLPFAEKLTRLGASVHLFGGGLLANSIPESMGKSHGRLSSDGVAKLFSQCTYYLDLSFMEGLGLLPLEAAFCGCRPIMTRKGAPDRIFDESNVTWLPSHLDFEGGAEIILNAKPLEQASIDKLRAKYTTELAYKKFHDIIKSKL